MKKLLLVLCLAGINLCGFSQAVTYHYNTYKIKMGHVPNFRSAFENHVNKFHKLGSSNEVTTYVHSNSHQSEFHLSMRVGYSWAQRQSGPQNSAEQNNNWEINILPHIEEQTSVILVYHTNYSNSPLISDDPNPNRLILTMSMTLKFAPPQEFWDVVAKHKKYWGKKGQSFIVLQSVTGTSTLKFTRSLRNGAKELDDTIPNREPWDELYGKGSYDQDMAIMRNYIIETDSYFLVRHPTLSSK